jgi:PAS domain S-box-containing protein
VPLARQIRWMALCHILFLLTLLVFDPGAGLAHAQIQPQTDLAAKNILVLHAHEANAPIFVATDKGVSNTLLSAGIFSLNQFFESLDLRRNPGPEHREFLVEEMRMRYSHRKLDMIITMFPEALEFVLKDCRDILPSVPILAMYLPQGFQLPETDRRIIGHAFAVDILGTLEIALKLVPGVKRVYVVSGVHEINSRMEDQTRRISRKWDGRLEFLYLSDMPFEEILATVPSVPPGSIILALSFIQDVTGKNYTAAIVTQRLSQVVTAPIFGISDLALGHGIAGGSLVSFELIGNNAGQLALDILRGTKTPDNIPTMLNVPPVPMFDWRQLKRWNLSEDALPEGSIVINKEFTLWDFRFYIIGALAFIMVQSGLIAGLVLNLGKRRRAELELSESKTLLSVLIDSTSDMIWSVDSERFGLLTFNRGLYEYFLNQRGIRIEAGMRPEDLFPPGEFVQIWHTFYHRALEEGSFSTEYLVHSGTRTVHLCISRLEHDDIVFGISVFGQDITERKRAETALAASEARYRTVADYTYDWEYWSAPDRRLIYISPSCKRITGYDPQEFIDNPSLRYEIIIPEDRQIWDRHKADARPEWKSREIQFRILTRDGEIRWIAHTCQPVTDQNGEFQGIRASNRDVTEKKMAEARAQQHRDELSHVTRVAALGELTSSLAHELNQPLAAILNYANAAQRFLAGAEPNLSKVSEALQCIVRDEKRAVEVIGRVRALLRKQEPQYSALSINEVIGESLDLFQGDSILKSLSIVTELAPGLPEVWGDRVHLQQVLINLTLNAAAAMSGVVPDSPRLVFRTEVWEDHGVKVSVKDYGAGIDEDHKDRLFEPFYTTKPQGFGMGLAICHNIIIAHGGTIWAENNPDGGAIFCFTLQVAAK